MIRRSLAYTQRLAGDTAGAKVTAEQALKTLEPLYRDQPDDCRLRSIWSACLKLCFNGREGLGSKS